MSRQRQARRGNPSAHEKHCRPRSASSTRDSSSNSRYLAEACSTRLRNRPIRGRIVNVSAGGSRSPSASQNHEFNPQHESIVYRFPSNPFINPPALSTFLTTRKVKLVLVSRGITRSPVHGFKSSFFTPSPTFCLSYSSSVKA